jgi:hypothetical protein
MNTLLNEALLPKLNSLTKYPSIPTYHTLGEKGRLIDPVQVRFEGECFVTEKIDGTNARLICTPEGVLVGSREDLLWATGDLIHNPAMGIVPALRDQARALAKAADADAILVIYGEVYGRSIGAAAKNYTAADKVGFRVFDAFEMSLATVATQLELPPDRLAHWRENGGQPFFDVRSLDTLADERGFERVPALGRFDASQMPLSMPEASAFLAPFAKSAAQLDTTARGESEGIVVRSADRRQIAKLRFEDYRRTLQARS